MCPLTQTRYTVAVRVVLGLGSCMRLKPEGLKALGDACASFVGACWAEGDSITLVCQALALQLACKGRSKDELVAEGNGITSGTCYALSSAVWVCQHLDIPGTAFAAEARQRIS